MMIHVGNGEIKAHFWIVIPLWIELAATQLHMLAGATQVTIKILSGKILSANLVVGKTTQIE